jgi:hypothetical protein
MAAVAGRVTVKRPALLAIIPTLTVKFRFTASTDQVTTPPTEFTVIAPAALTILIPAPEVNVASCG